MNSTMNYMLAAHDAVEDLCKEARRLESLLPDNQRDRIWVSDDRKVLITMWASGKVTIAVRSDPSWTWGPPETLTEEKT